MHTALLVVSIWGLLVLFGLFQERIATAPYGGDGGADTGERFTGTPLLYLVGTFASALVASVAAALTRQTAPPPATTTRAHLQFGLVALCACVGSPLAYISLRFIDYPLLVLASSCKLLPIILVGSIAHSANYGALDFATAGAMGVGVALYSTTAAAAAATTTAAAALPPPATPSASAAVLPVPPPQQPLPSLLGAVSPAVSTGIGLALVALNLLIDGVMTTGQDALYARYRVPPFIMMARINGWGAALVAAALGAEVAVSGWQASIAGGAAAFIGCHPSLGLHLVGLAACSALAQLFVYVALRRHGSFVTTAITISRKFVSVLLSVVLFGHELTRGQWVGVGAVFAGLSLQLLAGAGNNKKQQLQKQQQEQEQPATVAEPLRGGGAGAMPGAPAPEGDRATGEAPPAAPTVPVPARLQPPRTPPLRVAFGTVSTPHLTSYDRVPLGTPVPLIMMDEATPPNSGGGGGVSRRPGAAGGRRQQFRLDS